MVHQTEVISRQSFKQASSTEAPSRQASTKQTSSRHVCLLEASLLQAGLLQAGLAEATQIQTPIELKSNTFTVTNLEDLIVFWLAKGAALERAASPERSSMQELYNEAL